MHFSVVFNDDIGTQLYNGIFSWQFLQFLVAFLSIEDSVRAVLSKS